LTEDLQAAVHHCLTVIASRLNDKIGDIQFCRQRLRNLSETIESGVLDVDSFTDPASDDEREGGLGGADRETFWEAMQGKRTAQVILPGSAKSLDTAAQEFVASLNPEQWQLLDQTVGEQVLQVLGGLPTICLGKGNLLRSFAMPLVEGIAGILQANLPVTDVAQALAGATDDTVAQLRTLFARATPMARGESPFGETMFLLTPPSEAGKALATQAKEVLESAQPVVGPEQAHLMFCREHGNLSSAALQELLQPLQAAYESLVNAPQTSPHSRFDIGDWAPLYT
jgi:hypothetical protein